MSIFELYGLRKARAAIYNPAMPDENALAEAIAEARKNIEQRVTALIEEARRENCLFFRCRLDLNAPALPVQIRFSDRGGRIYRRNIFIWQSQS